MSLQLSEIALAVNGRLIGNDGNVAGVSIDTRSLRKDELYIALQGKNFDGHTFIPQAEQAGAAALLLERNCESGLPRIIVDDSRLALAELAGYWRNKFDPRVVGITGSNGKTTVKEMVAAILDTRGKTLLTRGNLNNDIGVPLTLMRLDESFRYAVIEMGANHAGEIAYTSRYARANVSLITNVGPAHIEGFGSIAGIAAAKGEIIENLGAEGVAILNRDDEFYEFWRQLAGKRKTVSFGFSPSADVSATDIGTKLKEQSFETHFVLHASIGSIDIILQLAGEHNVKNALAAAAAVMQFGFDLPSIKQGLESVPPVTGRVQLLRGRKGSYVIDDTYNANPASLRAALTVLDENNDNWLILGAFSELGPDSQAIHNEMGKLIKSMPVKRLFAVGENAEKTVETFGSSGAFFNSQEQLINAVNQVLTGKETILVKGSRSQKMENVVAALVDNFRAA